MAVDPQLLTVEYRCILRRAAREGWLAQLVEAHASPCTIEQAQQMLNRCGLRGGTRITFRNRKGWARFNKHKRYHIGLPNVRGGRQGRLRRGLVLHEASHILDHMQRGEFGHQENFCKIFRRLLEKWRVTMPGNYKEIYDRHKGPYRLTLTRQVEVKGKQEHQSDRVEERFSAEDAHEEARMLVNDPKENIVNVYVFSESEGQFIGALYIRGADYRAWDAMRAEDLASAGLVAGDQPAHAEAPAPTLVQEQRQVAVQQAPLAPKRDVNDNVPRKAPIDSSVPKLPKAPRKVSSPLQLAAGKLAEWPQSAAAQEVLGLFQNLGSMTAKQAAETLGPRMVELGVAHPASLVSRLKQAGLLEEKSE